MPERTVRAAGGVLWRRVDDEVQVALVHRPKYDDWSLPKGKLDRGESWVAGAVREVREETGFGVAVGRTLGESRYRVLDRGRDAPKTVRWWAMRALEGSFTAGTEVDALRWVPARRALAQAGSGYDTAPLTAFLEGPAETTTVLLLDGAAPEAVLAAYRPTAVVVLPGAAAPPGGLPVEQAASPLAEVVGRLGVKGHAAVVCAAPEVVQEAYGAGAWALSLDGERVVDVAPLLD